MRDLFTISLTFAAIACIALAQVTGIGYALYLWAHDMALGLALWSGFLLWFKLMVTGLLSGIIGIILKR